MTETFARCIAELNGLHHMDRRRATFGTLLGGDALVALVMVAALVQAILRLQFYPHCEFRCWWLICHFWLFGLLVLSRVCAHEEWRLYRRFFQDEPELHSEGYPGVATRHLRVFYPKYKAEDEWNLLIKVEPHMTMALGIGVLAWFPSVIGVFLIVGGICLKVYGKKLREEVEMAEHRAKYEEEAKMKAAAQKSAAEKAEKEKREDRRYFASVVSPPRISCEEVFDDEDIPAGD